MTKTHVQLTHKIIKEWYDQSEEEVVFVMEDRKGTVRDHGDSFSFRSGCDRIKSEISAHSNRVSVRSSDNKRRKSRVCAHGTVAA